VRILLTGATGLVGKQVGQALVGRGHQIFIVSRNINKAKATLPFPFQVFEGDFSQVDGVIHLAGENIASGRWSKKRKKQIYDSRVLGTRNLISGLANEPALKFFISASAIGYYGSRGNETLTETSVPGSDFLSQVCQDWEKSAVQIKENFPNVGSVILRLGMVLSSEGGAFVKMNKPFKFGLGAILGSGKQWMSWIHIHDLTELIVQAADNKKFEGIINAVAPEPITNKRFSEKLAALYGKKVRIMVPGFALRLGLGEMAELVLASQKVDCSVLKKQVFNFTFSTLDLALKDLKN